MTKDSYLFQSDRLGFRNWVDADIEEFAMLNADEEVMEHFPKVLSRKEVVELIENLKRKFSENGFTYYVVEVLDTNEFIGMIGLAYQDYKTEFTPAIDIGWRLKRKAWGNGYATEGAKRCLKYAFDELDIKKIIAVCTLKNKKSEHVMRKIGMIKVGTFDHPKMTDIPEYQKHICYEIKKSKSNSLK